jgi:multimeric flavodoxin WrbA
MKVLLVNGSPHKDGCTFRALTEVKNQLLQEGVQAEIFWIGTKTQGCIACASCKKTGKCAFDDKVNEFATLAKDADGFVFGCPVYYGSAAGGMTAFMDRLFYSAGKILQYKPSASVVSCRRGGASEAFSRLNMYYTINNMPVVSSQYWNQVHGNSPAEVERDEEGLQTMRTLARNMAWLVKSVAAGKEKGIPMPEVEPRIATNFIR